MNMRMFLFIVLFACSFAAVSAYHEPMGSPSYGVFIDAELHDIMYDGSYSDLKELRKLTDINVLPWITSVSDFRSEQRRIEKIREAIRDEQELSYKERLKLKTSGNGYRVVYYGYGRPTIQGHTSYAGSTMPAPTTKTYTKSYVMHTDRHPNHPLYGHFSLRHHYAEHR